MKKFLTVLLALSVVFTYSFSAAGAAFAATPTDPVGKTHAEAMEQAVKELTEELNKAVTDAKNELADTYTETRFHANCVIPGSAYAAALDKLASDYTNVITIAASEVDKENPKETNITTLKNAIKSKNVNDVIVYNNQKETTNIDYISGKYANLDEFVTAAALSDHIQAYYAVYAWVNGLDSMKAFLNGEIAKMDLAQYTNDVADEKDPYKTTWRQKAEKAKADLEKIVADTVVSTANDKSTAATAISDMYKVLSKLTAVKTVQTIDGKTIVTVYKLADSSIKTEEDLNLEDSGTEATKAELKAKIQSNAATAQKKALEVYNNSDKGEAAKTALETSKENIAAYVEVNTVLIDEGTIKKAEQFKQGNEADRPDCLKRVKTYEAAVDDAATLKLQVEKDGSLKYIASKIDENLAKVKIEIYHTGKAATALTEGAENKSDNLAWLKEVALANVDEELESALYNADKTDKYYAPEKAKVEAKYQEWKDKINAAESVAQLEAVDTEAEPVITIDDKKAVDRKVKAYLNTDEFIKAVNHYIDYLNIGIASYADGYREKIAKGDADAVSYLAENGARSNADVAGLLNKAEEYAKSLPTRGDAKAEKAAVDALVKEIPNVVTLADKPAVKAAWEAAKKADYFPTKLNTAVTLVKNAESAAIDNMIKALPAKLTAADKEKVDAIYAAINAYEAEAMYNNAKYGNKTAARKAFEAVRAATLADVQNAIAALSANPTKAQVEAARAAVEEFVKTYTDAKEPYQAIAMIVNLDKLTYAEAQVKANIIASVEGLKLSVSTKLYTKSNKIRVNWKVKDGDASYIDGYQVYKSTKAQKNYKYMGKTKKSYMDNKKGLKKGTRYFYKVRAYVEIDGQKYYSDWSNKGNRIYK